MWCNLVDDLKELGLAFDAGLTDSEISAAEAKFGIHFPADLRAFLQTALPVGPGFPDWRSHKSSALREQLDLPRQGILFDIEHNGFWLAEWGPRPRTMVDATRIVNELLAEAPKLIPIYVHRMMPDSPRSAGNPVFSVHQTDIIYYGVDLRDYLIHEFLAKSHVGVWPIAESVRRIEFWDLDRFQRVRWSNGPCQFDNSKGQLP